MGSCGGRQGEVEGGTIAGLRLNPYGAAMPLDDFLANCQTDAGSREFVALMQPLKHRKYDLEVFFIYAEPIVLYGKSPFTVHIWTGRYLYDWIFFICVCQKTSFKELEVTHTHTYSKKKKRKNERKYKHICFLERKKRDRVSKRKKRKKRKKRT